MLLKLILKTVRLLLTIAPLLIGSEWYIVGSALSTTLKIRRNKYNEILKNNNQYFSTLDLHPRNSY